MHIEAKTYEGRHFVVTGGLGYIGASLSSKLAALGARVTIVDNSYCPSVKDFVGDLCVQVVEGDVRDFSLMRRVLTGTDGCFHLAALSRSVHYDTDPATAQEVNVLGTSTVASASFARPGIPLVFASSAAVYGCQAGIPILEGAQCEPISQYGRDKLRGEQNIALLAKDLRCRATCLRLFNVCGLNRLGEKGDGVLARLASTGTLDQRFHVHGSGKQTRDYVHVEDVIAAFLAAMSGLLRARSYKIGYYNVCSGVETSVLELIKMTGTRMDYCKFVPQDDQGIPRSVGSNNRILSSFGPHDFKSLREIVSEIFSIEPS